MRFILFILTVHCLGCTLAQTPDNVKASFNEKYKNAEEVSWGLDRNGSREAHFEIDGEKYRADFTPDGRWIETEQNLKWKELPEIIQDSFKARFDKDDIVEIEKVDHYEKGIFYDIEIKKSGQKSDIEINPEGLIMNVY